jgi:hypothetical protein
MQQGEGQGIPEQGLLPFEQILTHLQRWAGRSQATLRLYSASVIIFTHHGTLAIENQIKYIYNNAEYAPQAFERKY